MLNQQKLSKMDNQGALSRLVELHADTIKEKDNQIARLEEMLELQAFELRVARNALIDCKAELLQKAG